MLGREVAYLISRNEILSKVIKDRRGNQSYANERFDQASCLARQLTELDRKYGKQAPAYGYSFENYKLVEKLISEE